METFKNYSEYLLRVFQTADYSGQTVGMVTLLLAMLCILAWYSTPWHLERAVSKRTMKTRHKASQSVAEYVIHDALEKALRLDSLTRSEVDYHAKKLREAGYKTVGLDETKMTGKPWYYGPAKMPDLGKVKREIYTRLHAMGVDVYAKLSKLKRSTPPKKIDEIMSKLKASKST